MVEILEGFPPEGRVVVDGYLVPHLSAITQADGQIALCLDRRFLLIAPREECDRWIWFVANAMAIGAGYSCFGENSVPMHPYKVQVHAIGAISEPVTPAA